MPKPKPTAIVCDTCGLPWERHKRSAKDTAPLSECVRLLRAELAKPRYPYGHVTGSAGVNPPTIRLL